MVVTLISLGLVFATLPRLLDGYFLDQAQQDLNRRTNVAGLFVALAVLNYQGSGGQTPKPILEGDPPPPRPVSRPRWARPRKATCSRSPQQIAQANVMVSIATDAANPEDVALPARSARSADEVGRNRAAARAADVGDTFTLTIPDSFWSQTSRPRAQAPADRVRCQNPYTYRAQTHPDDRQRHGRGRRDRADRRGHCLDPDRGSPVQPHPAPDRRGPRAVRRPARRARRRRPATRARWPS